MVNSDWNWTEKCKSVTKIQLQTMNQSFDNKTLVKMRFSNLEELIVGSKYELCGDRLFYVNDNCLHSLQLPKSIKKVNGKEISLLESFEIPIITTFLS